MSDLIPVFRPSFGDEEIDALREPFRTGWIGLGPRTREFEERFAERIGANGAVAVNSCTAALHLAMILAGVQHGEVITTPMTFVSTNHAILYAGATPVFVDILPSSLNIDHRLIEQAITTRTRAIVIVHYGGQPCEIDSVLRIADEHGIAVIEDCAHALGSYYGGRHVGTFGEYGCFSFHAVKNLATGDGGMIVFKDEKADERLRRLAWLGISRGTWDRSARGPYSWEYDVEELGFKYHMNDIAAALGLVQLGKLEWANGRRRAIALQYIEELRDLEWLELPVEADGTTRSWHNFVIKTSRAADRDKLIEFLRDRGVSTGVHYIPNHLYPIYQPFVRGGLPIAEEVWRRLVSLPIYPDLDESGINRVIAAVKDFGSETR